MRELLARHPLFGRLSGQVVWNLLEEEGVPEPDIDGFMLRLDDVLPRVAEFVKVFLNPPGPGWLVRLELSGPLPWGVAAEAAPPAKACAVCRALDGFVFPAGDPASLPFLPPFSLGCRLWPRLVPPGGGKPAAGKGKAPGKALLPPSRSRLACDDGWIFRHPWAAARS